MRPERTSTAMSDHARPSSRRARRSRSATCSVSARAVSNVITSTTPSPWAEGAASGLRNARKVSRGIAPVTPIDEAIWFRRTLEQSDLPFAGVLVNRVHHDLLGDAEPDDLGAALAARLSPDLAAKVGANFRDYHVLARRDHGNIARLAQDLGDRPLLLVPQLDDDVHDIEGLLRMHRYLFATRAQRAQLIDQVVA